MAESLLNIQNLGVATPPLSNNVTTVENADSRYQVVLNVSEQLSRELPGIFPLYGVLPERYSLSVGADYDTPLAETGALGAVTQGASSIMDKFKALTPTNPTQRMRNLGLEALSGVVKNIPNIAEAAGSVTSLKSQLIQMYQSGQPLSFNVDFVLNATTNPEFDVKRKLIALLKLCSPVEFGDRLESPGVNLIDSTKTRTVSLQLGKFLFLEEAIIKSVTAEIQSVCGVTGIPMTIKVNVGLESIYTTVTNVDIDTLFQGR